MSKKDIENSEILISLGVSSDWSFETDFLKYKKVPIIGFDGTISSEKFLKDAIKLVFRLYKTSLFINSIKVYFSYLAFFRNSIKHIQEKISTGSKAIS